MKKGLNRLFSSVLAAAMIVGAASFTDISAIPVNPFGPMTVSAAENYITDQGGWFESAYVEWTTVPDATGFAAYVKGADEADSAYVQLDNELIRKYPTYFRADAVGLTAGSYVIKVVPVINDVLDESAAFVSNTLTVEGYDRSGFAFSSASTYGTGSGAYNDDGTLKSDAKVFYVTADTAKTITTDVITSSKGTSTTFTGMQAIITAKQKGYDTTPFDFRIIGTIEADDMDGFDSSEEGLQVKGKNSYSELNITIEGIGEDAAINGFGILMRNAANVELRNFAIMSCMDDCVSIDTDNCNLWVHNIDFFYGNAGSANDQAKGDGTIDVKGDSQYITISYNHLFDSGKSSLCGMTSESGPNYITYHHNWFDHSDSRHPRIRTMSVHVYNNYYDGNSKYGVGAAKNSSAFVESNYFENCKHPMLSSMQGSDLMGSSGYDDDNGTFSSENGGIIKAYNNIVVGSDSIELGTGSEPIYYGSSATSDSTTNFDAYLVSSRSETVPSTVTALQGGSTYTNFDTSIDLGVDESDITPVADVPSVVTASAGRMNGGDFFETTGTSRSDYTALTDATDYSVDTTLKNNILNYKSTLVSVGGMTSGGTVTSTESTSTESTTETTTSSTDSTTETTTVSTESTTETTTGKTYNLNASDLAEGTYTESFTHNEFTINATAEKTVAVAEKSASAGGVTASKAISLGGAGAADYRSVTFTTSAAATIKVMVQSTGDDDRVLNVVNAETGEVVAEVSAVNKSGTVTMQTVELTSAGTYYVASSNKGMYLYYLEVAEAAETDEPVVTTYLWGDFNNDGTLDASDAASTLQHVLNSTYVPDVTEILDYLDVTADGAIAADDAAAILQKVLNSSFVFVAEQ